MSTVLRAGGLFVAIVVMAAGLGVPGSAKAQIATNLICNGCVGYTDLGKNAVRKRNIKKNQVYSKHIKNNQIKPKDLNKYAKPARGAYDESTNDVNLPSGDYVLLTVTVTTQGPGMIMATGSLYVYFSSTYSSVYCEVTQDTVTDAQYIYARGASGYYMPVSQTRGFPVSAAGDYDINLVCDESAGSVSARNPSLAAVFVPEAY
jgi:hypothetical protein